MKTTFYFILAITFSALLLTPKFPKVYPPKYVMDQRRQIVFKEQKIEHIIDKIEYELRKDSITDFKK